jgi:hypothetical protein
MATKQPDEWETSRSEDKTYNFTSTTFIKREIPLHKRRHYQGKPVIIPFLPERFQNEAAALQLIRERTSIPVPELIGWGRDENGLLYLEILLTLWIICIPCALCAENPSSTAVYFHDGLNLASAIYGLDSQVPYVSVLHWNQACIRLSRNSLIRSVLC